MATVIESGNAPNLHNTVVSGQLAPDATIKKFATFINDLGGVHTIIVDAEHAAQDADQLLQWFEHTRAQVTASASLPTDPNHRTPDQVFATADARMGFTHEGDQAQPTTGEHLDSQGG